MYFQVFRHLPDGAISQISIDSLNELNGYIAEDHEVSTYTIIAFDSDGLKSVSLARRRNNGENDPYLVDIVKQFKRD